MENNPDANELVAAFLATQEHCEALAALALTAKDVDLAVFLQRLLALAAPAPEDSTQAADACPDP